MYDNINKPQHYNQGNIECIDFIEEMNLNKTGAIAGSLANVVKYLWRYEDKGKPIEDVKKALWYMERAILVFNKGLGVSIYRCQQQDTQKLNDVLLLMMKTKPMRDVGYLLFIFNNLFKYYDNLDDLMLSKICILNLLHQLGDNDEL